MNGLLDIISRRNLSNIKYQYDDECYNDVFDLKTSYLFLYVVSVSNIKKEGKKSIDAVRFAV